jgi:hypothetical protein
MQIATMRSATMAVITIGRREGEGGVWRLYYFEIIEYHIIKKSTSAIQPAPFGLRDLTAKGLMNDGPLQRIDVPGKTIVLEDLSGVMKSRESSFELRPTCDLRFLCRKSYNNTILPPSSGSLPPLAPPSDSDFLPFQY